MRWKLALHVAFSLLAYVSAQVLREENRVTTAAGVDIKPDNNSNTHGLKIQTIERIESFDEEENNTDIEDEITDVEPDETETDPEPEPEPDTEDDGSEEIVTPAEIVVETTHGLVQGYLYGDMANIVSFNDIPYGTIDGHFKPPVEIEPWEETHQVQEHTSQCPQPVDNETITGNLNCLTLSIFAPVAAENAGVIFHIHDGNFRNGSGDPAMYGPEHLVPKGVILVLPNYRLGPLGFLCLRNETAPGNAGLKDLTLALNWIANNIAAFGGDPSNIVVSGEGLAGILVGYLTLSPVSSIYISKAITESGSVLSQWALDRDPVNTALHLADKLKDNNASRTLAEASLTDLILQSKHMLFLPCVEESEGALVDDTPWHVIHETRLSNKTFMIGSANFAGLHDYVSHTPESIEELNNDMRRLLPNDLCFSDNAQRVREAEIIKRQYFEEGNITVNDIEKLTLYYTDSLYLGPSIRSARPLVDAGATVYFYEFSYVGKLSREVLELPVQFVAGAARGDLAGYLFTKHGEGPEKGSEDQHMVDLVTDIWVSFVNTGQPIAEGVTWNELKQSDPSDEEWLSIGFNTTQKRGVHTERLALWTRLYRDHYIENSAIHCALAPTFLFTATFLFFSF